MNIHLIAIGGSAMHNIALALKQMGHTVTGSDDEIYEPALSRLSDNGILPDQMGWFPERITERLDAIILGMHARSDNPELARAQELGIKIYSYPEFVYEISRDKKRVVIGGSHGKTTTTSMIMHVLKSAGMDFDYLVGAQIPGFDLMVRFSDAPVIIIEGDEYLSSCLDKRPKFLHYRPHLSVITGISWDHINVFPEFEDYKKQFKLFIESHEPGATLFYYSSDEHLKSLTEEDQKHITAVPYGLYPGADERYYSYVERQREKYSFPFFGKHNLENMFAAQQITKQLGIDEDVFLTHITRFEGASRRLQQFIRNGQGAVYFDFAHAPSKVRASVQAVRLQFPDLKIRSVFELHTFSSLNKDFLKEYAYAMKEADEAIVFFDQHTLTMKKMSPLSPDYIRGVI
jgi:UDP-N-acetylmuramate: L-alanyl-gamma-D-glutamyl-meso-diaminopimelate ligase